MESSPKFTKFQTKITFIFLISQEFPRISSFRTRLTSENFKFLFHEPWWSTIWGWETGAEAQSELSRDDKFSEREFGEKADGIGWDLITVAMVMDGWCAFDGITLDELPFEEWLPSEFRSSLSWNASVRIGSHELGRLAVVAGLVNDSSCSSYSNCSSWRERHRYWPVRWDCRWLVERLNGCSTPNGRRDTLYSHNSAVLRSNRWSLFAPREPPALLDRCRTPPSTRPWTE